MIKKVITTFSILSGYSRYLNDGEDINDVYVFYSEAINELETFKIKTIEDLARTVSVYEFYKIMDFIPYIGLLYASYFDLIEGCAQYGYVDK